MIQINGEWEMINGIEDIIRIAGENLGDEFAEEIRNIQSEFNNDRLEELEEKIDGLEFDLDEYAGMKSDFNELNELLDSLHDYIRQHDDGSEFIKGMIKAYEMMDRIY